MARRRGLLKFWYGWKWLRAEGSVLWKAFWDKDTPMSARLVALGMIAYVISPIDIIPDFIPIMGWMDDIIVIPLGFALIRWLVPEQVWLRSGGTVVKDVTP